MCLVVFYGLVLHGCVCLYACDCVCCLNVLVWIVCDLMCAVVRLFFVCVCCCCCFVCAVFYDIVRFVYLTRVRVCVRLF